MTARAALAMLTLAGFPAAASAQEFITYSWIWSEVVANTSTPVPAPNGMLEPGEGARLALTATVTPGIGTPATYQAPPAPGHGTIAGLGSIFCDLFGTGADGGQWGSFRRRSGWALGGVGVGQPNGDIFSITAGQFVLQGAMPTNPVANIWSATWTPSPYAPRTAAFQSTPAAMGMGNHSSIVIQYAQDPNTGKPLYVHRFVGGDFGNSGPIPIVPCPASLAPFSLAGLATMRRRRPVRRHPLEPST